uniref:Uncharacterized protein n=1 Tax=Rhizophora mucronata TaxID=61149 RepID=A0A2P2MLT6_RHIMU
MGVDFTRNFWSQKKFMSEN